MGCRDLCLFSNIMGVNGALNVLVTVPKKYILKNSSDTHTQLQDYFFKSVFCEDFCENIDTSFVFKVILVQSLRAFLCLLLYFNFEMLTACGGVCALSSSDKAKGGSGPEV